MMALVTTLYLIGSVISYIMIVSVSYNTYKMNEQSKASALLIYTTIIVYTIGSWFSVLLFGMIGILDPWFRKLVLLPLHFKFKPKIK